MSGDGRSGPAASPAAAATTADRAAAPYLAYRVWDLPTRLFHWINLLCVLGLGTVGLVILYASDLGVPNPGKVLLKTLHVWFGYALTLNLCGRLVWAFAGNHHARWRQMLPLGRAYWHDLRRHLAAIAAGRQEEYLGHNPVGRLAVAALIGLLLLQIATGLLLAGTDLFFWPFGPSVAQWIAAPGVDPASLAPYSPDSYDAAAFAAMRALRAPWATVHLWGAWLLAGMAVIHVAGVVWADGRRPSSLVSAMVNGHKLLSGRPADARDEGDAAG